MCGTCCTSITRPAFLCTRVRGPNCAGSQLRGGYESDRFRLMLYERATGKITDVSPSFDRWVDSIVWAPDSKTIYFTAENEGEAPIYVVNITTANPLPLELVAGFNDSPTL